MNTFLFISWFCSILTNPLHQAIFLTEIELEKYKNTPTLYVGNSNPINDANLDRLINWAAERQMLEEKLKKLRLNIK